MKRNKRGGVILLLVLAVSATVALYFVLRPRETGECVVVKVDGREEGVYSLYEDGVYVLNGGTNTLEIKDGRARMIKADCPDAICIKQGWVSRMGECITCLPNRVVVEVVKENDSVDLVI